MCTAPNFNQEPFNGNREKIMQCMTSTSRFRGHHDRVNVYNNLKKTSMLFIFKCLKIIYGATV